MTTSRIMLWVLAMLLPGLAAMTYIWGLGVIWNVVILSLTCVLAESAVNFLKGTRDIRDIYAQLTDCTALLTAWLIAICLPPFTHAGILCLASITAIGLAKHAYGGFGRNLFNPAMVGYAVVLVSFPQNLAHWPDLTTDGIDALSGATLLTEFRYRQGLTAVEFDQLFVDVINHQQLIALSFFIGGMVLVFKGLLAWRIPAAMFAAVAACALIGYDQGSSVSLGSAWFHWGTGGFVAAAFFIATDPVTHPRQPRGQIVFGLVVGAFIYTIRAYGSFPDGIAFAVLFANCLTPLLNRYAARSPVKFAANG
jgi:electron transport complex protein RnfD